MSHSTPFHNYILWRPFFGRTISWKCFMGSKRCPRIIYRVCTIFKKKRHFTNVKECLVELSTASKSTDSGNSTRKLNAKIFCKLVNLFTLWVNHIVHILHPRPFVIISSLNCLFNVTPNFVCYVLKQSLTYANADNISFLYIFFSEATFYEENLKSYLIVPMCTSFIIDSPVNYSSGFHKWKKNLVSFDKMLVTKTVPLFFS